jgi:hypothetical protein
MKSDDGRRPLAAQTPKCFVRANRSWTELAVFAVAIAGCGAWHITIAPAPHSDLQQSSWTMRVEVSGPVDLSGPPKERRGISSVDAPVYTVRSAGRRDRLHGWDFGRSAIRRPVRGRLTCSSFLNGISTQVRERRAAFTCPQRGRPRGECSRDFGRRTMCERRGRRRETPNSRAPRVRHAWPGFTAFRSKPATTPTPFCYLRGRSDCGLENALLLTRVGSEAGGSVSEIRVSSVQVLKNS